MKRVFLLLLLCALSLQFVTACTTFLINKNGQLVFGRNYDWITASGMICSNLRGLQKTSMKTEDGTAITWVSKYGSLTFNQYGKEFPTGGMNEKGLVVEVMWLEGTRYPKSDSRPAVDVLQWIQYQLDCSETVDDVIASDKTLRISTDGAVPLHYLVADAKGNVATIEFLEGKLVVHKGKDLPFPVLTNNTYEESINRTKNASGNQSFADNSINRFAKACSMIQQFNQKDMKTAATDYAFNILDKVSQGNWTKWSIVYDISNKKIRFKTDGYTSVKSVCFDSFDFNCSTTSKMYNINQNEKGDVGALFTDFSVKESRPVLETAVRESASYVAISDTVKEAILNYNSEIKCAAKKDN
jgi:penicillin V acylase-like amidase (Ntn superfamily)